MYLLKLQACLAQRAVTAFLFALFKHDHWATDSDQVGMLTCEQSGAIFDPGWLDQHMVCQQVEAAVQKSQHGRLHGMDEMVTCFSRLVSLA